jgi:hypothetical protein
MHTVSRRPSDRAPARLSRSVRVREAGEKGVRAREGLVMSGCRPSGGPSSDDLRQIAGVQKGGVIRREVPTPIGVLYR